MFLAKTVDKPVVLLTRSLVIAFCPLGITFSMASAMNSINCHVGFHSPNHNWESGFDLKIIS